MSRIIYRPSCAFSSLLIFVLASVTSSHGVTDLLKLDAETGFNSVYLLENPRASVIRVGLTVLAGEVDVEGPEGLSHYLEHLVFWHADNIDDQQLHARSGNASVNGIVTNYFNEGEKSELDDMFEFIQRLFVPLNLDREFMLRERSVVAREYDLRVSENPNLRGYYNIRRDLYNNLPVSRSTIGTPETIQSLTLEQASEFQEKFYHPGNSVLFIAGNLGKEEAELVVNTRFGELKPGSRHAAGWRDARIEKTSDITQEFRDSQVNFERLIFLTLSEWPEGQSATENWYTLLLLNAALDSALEGGIARPLRMDNFVLRSFDMGLDSFLSDYFELTLFAEPDKDVSLDQASQAISDTLDALAENGIPEATLERVRSRMLQTESRRINDMNHNIFRMSRQLSSGLSPVDSVQHLEKIKTVSLMSVNKLLRALAKPKRRSIAFIKPNGE